MGKHLDLWTKWLGGTKDEPTKGSQEGGAGDLPPLLQNRTGRNLVVLGALGALLIVLGRVIPPEQPASGELKQEQLASVPTSNRPEALMAAELTRILSQIEGVGKVDVYISLDTGPEQVLAEEVTHEKTVEGSDTATVRTNTRETRRPITIRDDAARAELPVVLVENQATVRGVIVVAGGADKATVRYRVTQAVQTALGVAAHRVSVFARVK